MAMVPLRALSVLAVKIDCALPRAYVWSDR